MRGKRASAVAPSRSASSDPATSPRSAQRRAVRTTSTVLLVRRKRGAPSSVQNRAIAYVRLDVGQRRVWRNARQLCDRGPAVLLQEYSSHRSSTTSSQGCEQQLSTLRPREARLGRGRSRYLLR